LGVNPTRIGALRHRVTFQTLTRTPDGQGGYTSSWADMSTNPTVWGEVVPKSTPERFFSQAIQYQRTHQVTIRYRSDLTQEMRMLFDSRIFQIKGIRKPDERRFFLIIDLEENQGT
jgi:SPP1 family predicted phage head-tail adaptor